MLSVPLFALTLAISSKTAVTASSASIPIRRQLSGGHEYNARINALAAAYARDEAQPVLSFSDAGVAYTADVGVGNPPTTYTLLVDTGSSSFWVGNNKTFVPTSSSAATNESFYISYGTGDVYGEQYLDLITLSSSLTVTNQSIGVSNRTGDFDLVGIDGILGLAQVASTAGTLPDHPDQTVPTLTNNMLSQGSIENESVGIALPLSGSPDSTGSLTFGGVDTSKIIGDITYANSSSGSWYISQNISIDGNTFLSGAGIVDTGTILVYLAGTEFGNYMSLSGGSYVREHNLVSFTPEQAAALKPVDFIINGETFTLNADAQTWPVSQNSLIHGEEGVIYSIFSTYGNTFPFQFILGFTFLERFYTVFDTENSRIGFAYTDYTNATVNN